MLDKTNKSYGKNMYAEQCTTTNDIRKVLTFIQTTASEIKDDNYLLYLRNLFLNEDALDKQIQILKYFAYVSSESVKYQDASDAYLKANRFQIGTAFDVWPDLNYVIPMEVMKRFLKLVFEYRTWTMTKLVYRIQSIDDRELRNFVIEFYPVIEFILVNSKNAMDKLESDYHRPKEYLNRTDLETDPEYLFMFVNNEAYLFKPF